MRRKIIARLLVFCMIVSMLAVPAMATETGNGTVWNESTGAALTLSGNSSSTYTISSGAYTLDLNGHTWSGAITISGSGSLSVTDSAYNSSSSTNKLDSKITLSGTSSSFTYSVADSTYVIRGSAFDVISGLSNYNVSWSGTTATLAYAGGGGGGVSSSSSSSGSTTVTATTSVSGDTATVSVSSSAVTSAATAAESSADKTVTIDASKASANVTTATIQTSVLSTVSDASGVSLTIEMPAGDVTLSDTALAAVVAEAGANVSITLDVSNSTASLAAAQQESLAGLATGATIDVSVTSNGKEITSFGGGRVTLSVPFTSPAANRPANKFGVYYAAPNGGLTRQPTSYASGKLTFSTTHFSDYVAVFEPFADVTADLWYAQYALYASDHGIMNGTDKGFEGNLNLTRAMMVTTLYRIKGASAGSAAAFSDVASGQWFTDAVNWAAANGVASGVGDGKFAPNADMTREQMAQFLYNYAKANGKDVSKTGNVSQFADASSVSGWAKEAMAWAVGEGYINGMDGKLNPQGTATRAQVTTVLTRFAQA